MHIAHGFGVSAIAALYRLGNLRPRVLSDEERDRLKHMIDSGTADEVAKNLGFPKPSELYETHDQIKHRLVSLGLEAYRQELISRAKLLELGELVEISPQAMARLIEDSGIDEDD